MISELIVGLGWGVNRGRKEFYRGFVFVSEFVEGEELFVDFFRVRGGGSLLV